MSQEEYEQKITEMIKNAEGDFSRIDDFLSENGEDFTNNAECDEDIYTFAFKIALEENNYEYAETHIEDVDVSDMYYDTNDERMQKLLVNHGAYRDPADYEEYRFAFNTEFFEIIIFDDEFQAEVFEKYKEKLGLTDEDVVRILKNDEIGHESILDDSLVDLETIGIYLNDDGDISYADRAGDEDQFNAVNLLRNLGYECEFEGTTTPFEELGVYFVG